MTISPRILLAALFAPLLACAASEDASSEADVDANPGRGRTPPTDGRGATPDAGDGTTNAADGSEADDASGPEPTQDAQPSTPDGADPGTGGLCDDADLSSAIACQVEANEGAVAAFCDCFTERGYAGDRAACEADQPSAADFEPSACVRQALLREEPAAVRHALCYATAIEGWAACLAPCPPTRESFDACVTTLDAAFAGCDAALPASVTQAVTACEGVEPGTPPADVIEATRTLRRQRDAWAATLCACPGHNGAPDAPTCRSRIAERWNPGVSPCEQGAIAEDLAAAAPFVRCVEESFLIAETACMDCPSPFEFEFDLCVDPGLDIQFCFDRADPGLQRRLLACVGP
jgi:hypothetical protein